MNEKSVLDPDVAEMLLSLLGQVTLKASDPNIEQAAGLAARAQRQLTALAQARQTENPGNTGPDADSPRCRN